MKTLAIGGFFHDLLHYDSESNILVSTEEERFSRKKMHSVLGKKSSSIKGLEWIYLHAIFHLSIESLVFSDKVRQPIYDFFEGLFQTLM